MIPAGRWRAALTSAAVILLVVATSAVAARTAGNAAGTGNAGFSGDGGEATAAQVNLPRSVAGDRRGGFVIVDFGNHRIRHIAPDGTIKTTAGTGSAGFSGDGGPATEAQLNGPNAAAVAADGSVLIADTGNHRIRRVAPDGTIRTVAGSGPPGIDNGGLAGDGGPATAARLAQPFAVAPLLNGDFLIADTDNHRIRRVSRAGIITTVAGTGPGFPRRGAHSGNGARATGAHLNRPHDVQPTRDGGYLIADTGNNRIRKVTRDGIMTGVAGSSSAGYGGDRGAALEAQLNGPTAVAAVADGSFLIADTGNDRIRIVGRGGLITTTAGGAGLSPGRFYRPRDVAVADAAFLVADEGNHRIARVGLALDLGLLTRNVRALRSAAVRIRYVLPMRATVRVELRRRGSRVVRRVRRGRPGLNYVTLPRYLRPGRYSVRLTAHTADGQRDQARTVLTIRQ